MLSPTLGAVAQFQDAMRMRFKGLFVMPAAAAGWILLTANAAAQSAMEISGPTPPSPRE
jgi:hypothetical protein